jgi:hypothetical protein
MDLPNFDEFVPQQPLRLRDQLHLHHLSSLGNHEVLPPAD